MQKPVVSVIVLNYRSPRDTVSCIRALLAQTMRDRMEIILVDNHSDDESIALFRALFGNNDTVRIVESRQNVGYGQGMAIGAAQARGTYLFLMNPDNILEPHTLDGMVRIMEREHDIGILAPALMHPDGTVRPSARPFPTPYDLVWKRLSKKRWHASHAKRMEAEADSNGLRDVDWVAGTCLLIPRAFFEELHGFDPRFFLFFEDTDLCRRCALAGKRVTYAPSIRVADRVERLSDGGMLSLLLRRTGRVHLGSAARYFWKWRKGTPEKTAARKGKLS